MRPAGLTLSPDYLLWVIFETYKNMNCKKKLLELMMAKHFAFRYKIKIVREPEWSDFFHCYKKFLLKFVELLQFKNTIAHIFYFIFYITHILYYD